MGFGYKEEIGPETGSPPLVTVLIAADHDSKRHADLRDLRSCLKALATQKVNVPVEFLLIETHQRAREIPDDITAELPNLKILEVSHLGTHEQRNAAVQVAKGEIIAILDVDCVPVAGWLQSLIDTMQSHPHHVAVSGRTLFKGQTVTERCLALLSRGFLDPGRQGETRYISNDNAGILKNVFKQFPLPEGDGPFSAQVQSAALRRAGYRFLFQPGMTVQHDFEGWETERDFRLNTGWATIRMRQLDPNLRFGWLLKFGQLSIPIFYVGRVIESWLTCFRIRRQYGLSYFDFPIALGLTFLVHFLEIKGMWLAFRHKRLSGTKFY